MIIIKLTGELHEKADKEWKRQMLLTIFIRDGHIVFGHHLLAIHERSGDPRPDDHA